MNGAFVQVPWRVTVPAGAVIDGPLVLVHWLDKDGSAVFPRLEIEVGDNASLRVVEIVASADVEVLSVPVAHLYLRPGPASALATCNCSAGALGSWATR